MVARALLFPVSLIYLIPYALIVPLTRITLERAIKRIKSGIELNFDKSNSGDDWTGRVLDIMKRVNSNTNAMNAKASADMEDMERKFTLELKELKEQNAALLELLTRIGESNDKDKGV